MKYWMLTFLVTFMVWLSASERALACSCSASPMLSPLRMSFTTVDATVVRYVDGASSPPHLDGSMEVAISRVFQGEVPSDNLIVFVGKADGVSCVQDVTNYPIGSRWLLSFVQSSTNSQDSIVPMCYLHPAIVDDQIETRIRDYNCTDPYLGCSGQRETLTLDEYDELQRPYFAGARQAASYSEDRNSKIAAHYIVEQELLRLPYLPVFKRQRDTSTRASKPPISELNVTLKLVEGSNGQLLFDLTYIGPATPKSR